MSEQELRQIVRFKDTDLNGNISVKRAFLKIKGLSFSTIKIILKKAGVDGEKKLGLCLDTDLVKIDNVLKNSEERGMPSFLMNRRKDFDTGKNFHLVSTELDLENKSDIARMRQIKSYKGVRHSTGHKVRGQRTKSTGRKGPVAGVIKRKIA